MKFVQNFNPLTISRTFYASFVESGLNIQGGSIIIEKDTLIFKAHKLNFGDTRERKWEIHHICGYKKGFLTTMFIFLNNGLEIKLAVWQKDEIIKALEERRYAIFRNAGEEIPQLKRF